jgi:hypothetical protein
MEENLADGVSGCAREREGEGNQRQSSRVLYHAEFGDVLQQLLGGPARENGSLAASLCGE